MINSLTGGNTYQLLDSIFCLHAFIGPWRYEVRFIVILRGYT